MKTLILNAGFEPLQFVCWQRALCLVLTDKAEVISSYETVIRSVSDEFPLPSVIRLVRYVRRIGRLDLVRCSRKNVLLRDRYVCQYCGINCTKLTATIDHVIPKSKGGQTTWENTVTACGKCNTRKGSKTLDETSMTLIRQPRKPRVQDLFHTLSTEIKAEWLPYLAHLFDRQPG
jgi:5-methylcytosine-specific restriction endonuclease McrA